MCVYCVKCTKFVKLFLRKVIKIDATRCLDFSSKRPKMRLAAGFRPDPLGELKRSPRPPSRKKGAYFYGEGMGGKGGREGREEEGKGGEEKGEWRGGKGGREGREEEGRGRKGEGRGPS